MSLEVPLERFFSGFPGGFPGISLLVLRAVLGGAMLVEGGLYLGAANSLETWSLGIISLGTGALLLIGFLTPVASVLVGLITAGVAFSLLPSCTHNVFDSGAAFTFALAMLLTIAGVGPGRFSVDARLFGRREIIIPPRNLSSTMWS